MMQLDEEKKKSSFDEDNFQRLSDFLVPALQNMAPGKRIAKNMVGDAWAKVMGEQASTHVRVIGFKNEKLRLSTAELDWYRTVQKNKASIIDRLNTHLGSRVVEDVEVVFTG